MGTIPHKKVIHKVLGEVVTINVSAFDARVHEDCDQELESGSKVSGAKPAAKPAAKSAAKKKAAKKK